MRLTRQEYAQERHARSRRKPDAKGRLAYVQREVKRQMVAAGLIAAVKPKKFWSYDAGNVGGDVEAYTRSEARSLVKKALGCGPHVRLPPTVKLWEKQFDANQPGRS